MWTSLAVIDGTRFRVGTPGLDPWKTPRGKTPDGERDWLVGPVLLRLQGQ